MPNFVNDITRPFGDAVKIALYDCGEVESCQNETSIEITKNFSQRCDQLDVFFATKPH